jgi:DNA-binding MarR family transcriptional regulator
MVTNEKIKDMLKQNFVHANSIQTYNTLKTQGKLSPKRERVYKAVHFMGKCTNKQIAKFLNVPINEVTGRVAELVKAGMIKEAGTVKCLISNKPNALWTVC